MPAHRTLERLAYLARVGFLSLAVFQLSIGGTLASAANEKPDEKEKKEHSTATPIRHVIIVVGENRSFDHLFATYKPKHGQKVDNLLSKGIVNEDGTPGPNFSLALQYQADVSHDPVFELAPFRKTPYATLPPALTGGPSDVCKDNGICTLDDAITSEDGLAQNYYSLMLIGGTGQQSRVPDMRIANVNDLPPGPFQITGSNFHYDEYAASPVHRFYQMWQQLDCDASNATRKNPSGCKADLFPWVEVTVGAGSNGVAQATDFNNRSTGEGSTAMGFYNVAQGDAPYFKYLADHYAMSDNYHHPPRAAPASIASSSASVMRSGSRTPTVQQARRRTTRSSIRALPTKASWMKLKIQTLSPAPTTGIGKTVMAAAASASRWRAAALTVTAPTRMRPASAHCATISLRLSARSIRTALPATTICLTITTRATLAMAPTPTPTTTSSTPRSLFLRSTNPASPTCSLKPASPGNTTATSGTPTSATNTSCTTARWARQAISTATSAIRSNTRHRS